MPSRRIATALVTVVLLLALAACGGGDDDEAATTTTKPDGTSSTTTTRPSTTSTTASTATSTTVTVAPTSTAPTTIQPLPHTEPDANDHGPDAFSSPTGNIGCYLTADEARCDIAERSWEPPPQPESCEFDWGQGIVLDVAGAGFICAGDTTLGAETVLAYGQSAQRGRFLCESAQTGMTCTDTRTGAGFELSRGSYRLF